MSSGSDTMKTGYDGILFHECPEMYGHDAEIRLYTSAIYGAPGWVLLPGDAYYSEGINFCPWCGLKLPTAQDLPPNAGPRDQDTTPRILEGRPTWQGTH